MWGTKIQKISDLLICEPLGALFYGSRYTTILPENMTNMRTFFEILSLQIWEKKVENVGKSVYPTFLNFKKLEFSKSWNVLMGMVLRIWIFENFEIL